VNPPNEVDVDVKDLDAWIEYAEQHKLPCLAYWCRKVKEENGE